VSDELIIDILNKELDRLGDVPGIIFDGFPRTLSQASELKKMLLNRGTKISVLLFLDVPHEELIKRLLKRQSLDGRSDDTMEVIENRLRIYEEQTAPTIDFYRKQGKLRTIDGTGTIDEIFNRIDEVLKELN
jgi:adenylate kinase